MFYCLVIGSRTFNDYSLMYATLDKMLINYTDITIVSGGASGADALAERYAKDKGYALKVFPADWSLGKSAGYQRNTQMHQYIAQFPHRGCIAFWDGISRGTQHNFKLAEQLGNQIRIYKF